MKVPALDLLIVDLDSTFIYHRTVALANKLYLESFCKLFGRTIVPYQRYTSSMMFLALLKLFFFHFYRFRLKKNTLRTIFILTGVGSYLHLLNLLREFRNRFFSIQSNQKMIQIWARTLIALHLREEQYQLSMEEVRNHLQKKVVAILRTIKKQNPSLRVMGISQHFTMGKDHLESILGLDQIASNTLLVDKHGFITKYQLFVRNGGDKSILALKSIKEYKSLRIGLIIDDYDDISLLSLENLFFVLYKRKIKRFLADKCDIAEIF